MTTKTYYVNKREVHVSTVRVEAASEDEAIEKAKGDDGEEVMCEYSHTLDSNAWTVEEVKLEDDAERLARGWPAREMPTAGTPRESKPEPTSADWTLLARPTKNGHRYFRHPNGELALADNSGITPDRTEDGVLWVKVEQPLAPYGRGDGTIGYRVPLVRGRNGANSWTLVEHADMVYLRDTHGMRVAPFDPNY